MASMLVRKYEYDYTNLYQERAYSQDRLVRRRSIMRLASAISTAATPGEFPGVSVGCRF